MLIAVRPPSLHCHSFIRTFVAQKHIPNLLSHEYLKIAVRPLHSKHRVQCPQLVSTAANRFPPRFLSAPHKLITLNGLRGMASSGSAYRNRLAYARSPYLLQHAENPVDWYEWGADAFKKAKEENKPIFLSVGYSACHWCHVLAHESFEDGVTAKLMNDYYVNVKVDREERPDVDRLYMMFLQATTGRGGWPMSVWLTPDLHPFFAGTYFPPGQFRQVLMKLADIWESDPQRCINTGKQIIEQLRESTNVQSDSRPLPVDSLASSIYTRLSKRFDTKNGGFGGAPKFPQPAQTIYFLARFAALSLDSKQIHAGSSQGPDEAKSAEEVLGYLDAETDEGSLNHEPASLTPQSRKEEAEHARDMAVSTLERIYNGGIHDVVEGGFARYSVDEKWHVPHFEKMLYDQAQLLASAVELLLLLPTSSSSRRVLISFVRSILTYVPRHLRSPDGGFYSAEDADSLPTHESKKTKEGAFYTWTAEELENVLGQDAEIFAWAYGVEDGGNCDPQHDIQGELKGQNVLYAAHTADETAKKFGLLVEEIEAIINQCLDKLRIHRDKHRPRPHLDDKIVTAWNGLMITGLAKASAALEGDEASQALRLAEQSASFTRGHLYDEASGELRRSWREGPGPQGQADDYAFLIQGLLDLYEASGKEKYVTWAVRLQEKQDELFCDRDGGGYFASAPDEHILVRMKDAQDGAEPSAVSVTLSNLQRLTHFAEDKHVTYKEKCDGILASNAQLLNAAPYALATMVSAAMLGQIGYKQLILTESPVAALASPFFTLIRGRFIPNGVLIHLDPVNPPRELPQVNATVRSLVDDINKANRFQDMVPNVRVCENFTCGLPVENVEEVEALL